MAIPLNHKAEFHSICMSDIEREKKARLIGAMALRLEDEHEQDLILLAGGSVRRICEANPCLRIAALHRALGW